ncbi:MAG: hypothetical protein K0U64_07660 [Actinomycetia bacterium]|nr:hypothetical protein [Actinomycetes bacterium]
MWKSLLLGVIAAALGLGVWLLTSSLDLGNVNGLMGIVAGLILGLIPDHSPLSRYIAFLIGMVFGIVALVAGLAGWIGFVAVVVIFTIISALTRGHLPFWAMLLGSGSFAAIYAPRLFSDPWYILTDYPTTFFLVLATSAGGFMIAIFAEMWRGELGQDPLEEPEAAAAQDPEPQTDQDSIAKTANGG